jgi:hypothetical protein
MRDGLDGSIRRSCSNPLPAMPLIVGCPNVGSPAALARSRAGNLAAIFVDGGIVAGDVEAWRELCERGRGVPLVLTTAAAQGDVAEFGRKHAVALLAPPIELRTVQVALHAAIGRRGSCVGGGDTEEAAGVSRSSAEA